LKFRKRFKEGKEVKLEIDKIKKIKLPPLSPLTKEERRNILNEYFNLKKKLKKTEINMHDTLEDRVSRKETEVRPELKKFEEKFDHKFRKRKWGITEEEKKKREEEKRRKQKEIDEMMKTNVELSNEDIGDLDDDDDNEDYNVDLIADIPIEEPNLEEEEGMLERDEVIVELDNEI
jgi:hypothetical protein